MIELFFTMSSWKWSFILFYWIEYCDWIFCHHELMKMIFLSFSSFIVTLNIVIGLFLTMSSIFFFWNFLHHFNFSTWKSLNLNFSGLSNKVPVFTRKNNNAKICLAREDIIYQPYEWINYEHLIHFIRFLHELKKCVVSC